MSFSNGWGGVLDYLWVCTFNAWILEQMDLGANVIFKWVGGVLDCLWVCTFSAWVLEQMDLGANVLFKWVGMLASFV